VKIDLLRGTKLGCLGSLCFSIAPLLLAVAIAGLMGASTGDSSGSRALGFGILLFFVGNGSLAAFVTLGALAATSASPGRGTVAGIGGVAGALFTAALVIPKGTTQAWLLPLTSAFLVVVTWVVWRRIQSQRNA
jgi:uncharacterized membrane protein